MPELLPYCAAPHCVNRADPRWYARCGGCNHLVMICDGHDTPIRTPGCGAQCIERKAQGELGDVINGCTLCGPTACTIPALGDSVWTYT